MIQGNIEGSLNHVYEAMFRLETMSNYTEPLLDAWAAVLKEDNRRGVMQGVQGDGSPMPATRYRTSLSQTSPGQAGDTFFNASGVPMDHIAMMNTGPKMGSYLANLSGTSGTGFKPGPSHNLTIAQYKTMSGPPLAPRGPASRVISNYTVEIIAGNSNIVGVEGGWDDVMDSMGKPFLQKHFQGIGLPVRSLIGIRQWGKSQATKELNAWMKWLMTVSQPEYFGRTRAGHDPKYVRRKK